MPPSCCEEFGVVSRGRAQSFLLNYKVGSSPRIVGGAPRYIADRVTRGVHFDGVGRDWTTLVSLASASRSQSATLMSKSLFGPAYDANSFALGCIGRCASESIELCHEIELLSRVLVTACSKLPARYGNWVTVDHQLFIANYKRSWLR
jgi:hypothetical protein